jgi:hypothetical protein
MKIFLILFLIINNIFYTIENSLEKINEFCWLSKNNDEIQYNFNDVEWNTFSSKNILFPIEEESIKKVHFVDNPEIIKFYTEDVPKNILKKLDHKESNNFIDKNHHKEEKLFNKLIEKIFMNFIKLTQNKIFFLLLFCWFIKSMSAQVVKLCQKTCALDINRNEPEFRLLFLEELNGINYFKIFPLAMDLYSERDHYLLHNIGGKLLYNNHLIEILRSRYSSLQSNFTITYLFNEFIEKTCLLDENYMESNAEFLGLNDVNWSYDYNKLSTLRDFKYLPDYIYYCELQERALTDISLSNKKSFKFTNTEIRKIFFKKNFQYFKSIDDINSGYNYLFDKYNYFFKGATNNQLQTLGDFISKNKNEFTEEKSLYDYIVRGPNGNLMGLKSYKNHLVKSFRSNFLMGRYLDKTGTIIDNGLEYFYNKISLNYNLYKHNNITFQGGYHNKNVNNLKDNIYNNNTLNFDCNSLINSNSFLKYDKNNFFFECSNNYNLPKILVNGNDYGFQILNIIGFISDNISKLNLNYEKSSDKYGPWEEISMDVFDYVTNTQYNFPIKWYRSGKILFKETIYNDNNPPFPEPNSLRFNGIYFNIKNFSIGKNMVKSLAVNYKVTFFSWVINFELNQNDFDDTFKGYPYLKKTFPFETQYKGEKYKNDYSVFSCSPYNNSWELGKNEPNLKFIYYSQKLNSEIINDNINGYFSLGDNNYNGKNDGLNEITMVFPINQTFPWFTDNNGNYSNTFETIMRIPRAKLWDSIILQTNLDDKKIIIPQSKDFQNLYFKRNYNINNFEKNNTEEKIQNEYNEQIYSINFFSMGFVRKSFQFNELFTNIVDNDMFFKNNYGYPIEIYNDGNETFYDKLEILKNDTRSFVMGCNSNLDLCFNLDLNGFPLNILSIKPQSVVVKNENLSKFNWNVKNQWSFIQENIKYLCSLYTISYFLGNVPKQNLSLICFKDYLENVDDILFIYEIKEKNMFYPAIEKKNNYIIKLINNDVIYINKETFKGFSSVYHRKYHKSFFDLYDPNKITIQSIKNNTGFKNNKDFINYKYPHEVFLKNNFFMGKYYNEEVFSLSSIIGHGINGSHRLCTFNDKNKEFCLEGDISSSIVYYTQFNNNPLLPINNFSPLKSVNFDNWIGKILPGIFAGKQENINYKISNQTAGINYKINIDDYDIICNLIIDKPFDTKENIVFPLGTYCKEKTINLKFIELLLFPIFNIDNNQWEKNPSTWFLCEGSMGNDKCSFNLLNGNEISCNSKECLYINNNYIDRLNDPSLIELINTKYNLNVKELVSLHPRKYYFFPYLIESSFNRIVNVDYVLNWLKNYKSWLTYIMMASSGEIALILILYFIYNSGIDKRGINSGRCCFKYFLYSYFFVNYSKIMRLSQDIIVLLDEDFINLNDTNFIYPGNLKDIMYGLLSADIFLYLLDLFFLFCFNCNQNKNRKKFSNKQRVPFNKQTNLLIYFLFSFFINFFFTLGLWLLLPSDTIKKRLT